MAQAVQGKMVLSAGEPAQRKVTTMRITAIAVAGLLASTLVTASPAQAEVTAQPALSHFYPTRSPLMLSPQSEAEDLRQQIDDLDADWESLTPEQRNQRIAQLQQQVTRVDLDSRNLPQDQKAQVDAILLPSLVHLASLLRKAQTPPTSPCIFPFCLPGL
jgi:hypothetical protein